MKKNKIAFTTCILILGIQVLSGCILKKEKKDNLGGDVPVDGLQVVKPTPTPIPGFTLKSLQTNGTYIYAITGLDGAWAFDVTAKLGLKSVTVAFPTGTPSLLTSTVLNIDPANKTHGTLTLKGAIAMVKDPKMLYLFLTVKDALGFSSAIKISIIPCPVGWSHTQKNGLNFCTYSSVVLPITRKVIPFVDAVNQQYGFYWNNLLQIGNYTCPPEMNNGDYAGVYAACIRNLKLENIVLPKGSTTSGDTLEKINIPPPAQASFSFQYVGSSDPNFACPSPMVLSMKTVNNVSYRVCTQKFTGPALVRVSPACAFDPANHSMNLGFKFLNTEQIPSDLYSCNLGNAGASSGMEYCFKELATYQAGAAPACDNDSLNANHQLIYSFPGVN